jgi:nucleoside-diphosphate-sugar epimerase
LSSAPRRIVVTGVAGYRVTGIDDLSQGMLEQVPAEVELHRLDVRSAAIYSLFPGADAVFHLAAKNCLPDCQREPAAAVSVNISGTINVFEAARLAGVARVVYAESSALYEGVTQFPTPEDVVAPRSIYALTKQADAEFAAAYARFYGMTFTALRYFCVYGPHQDYRRTVPPVMSAFIIRLLRGERPIIYGTGEKRRDFVYVDDVNDFHVQCLTDERTYGGTFNVGSGCDHSVNEILHEIQGLLGTAVTPRHAPDQPGEAERTCADIGRARALGWQPRVSLRDGLLRSIAYLREHVVGGAMVSA